MEQLLPHVYGVSQKQTVQSGRKKGREYTLDINCFMLLHEEIEHTKRRLGEEYEKKRKIDGTLERLLNNREIKKQSFEHIVPPLCDDIFFIEDIRKLLMDKEWQYGKDYQLLWKLADECSQYWYDSWNNKLEEAFEDVKRTAEFIHGIEK